MTDANSPCSVINADAPGFDAMTESFGNSALKPFIAISGLIGAGKTTLATALAKELELPVYYEPVIDNVYLEDFYQDMKKYSFALQVYLLNKRFAQQQQIIWNGNGGVQDRSIYEDSVFARMLRNSGLMEQRDYETYISLFNHMSNFMKKPNVIVHLVVSPEESLRRIKMRNRGCETTISIEYLTSLHQAYEEFLHDIARVIPVIKVQWDEFQEADEVAKRIKAEYQRIQNIRHVDFESRQSMSLATTLADLPPSPQKPPKSNPANPADDEAIATGMASVNVGN
jgi:deoxyadenosine kinase